MASNKDRAFIPKMPDELPNSLGLDDDQVLKMLSVPVISFQLYATLVNYIRKKVNPLFRSITTNELLKILTEHRGAVPFVKTPFHLEVMILKVEDNKILFRILFDAFRTCSNGEALSIFESVLSLLPQVEKDHKKKPIILKATSEGIDGVTTAPRGVEAKMVEGRLTVTQTFSRTH